MIDKLIVFLLLFLPAFAPV